MVDNKPVLDISINVQPTYVILSENGVHDGQVWGVGVGVCMWRILSITEQYFTGLQCKVNLA